MRWTYAIRLLGIFILALELAVTQTTNGTISGIVFDPSGKAIPDAQIVIVNDATGISYPGITNSDGIYAIPNLPPGPYRIQVAKTGFKALIKPDIVLHVQDALAINFTLPIGAASEIVTVQGGAPQIDTESAVVSTVVDRQFAENLPLNGRSFQSLIYLTPGVVVTTTNQNDNGQFSVNGQRASSNYWMVDGVSANIGIGSSNKPGNGLGGGVGSFSALGGTNSLVSVDALQEFRIQTSTYAPEFGRTPGGQISIVTRSGTNQFHGTAFDYLRNDALDASNWFNGYTNDPPLAKAKERQNDFGGTLGGPIRHDQTFFFFSYEGLRLRLPQTSLTTVPDAAARLSAKPQIQPYLDAYPFDSAQPDLGSGIAQFNASYSNPASLDAYSLRIDHNIGGRLSIFARYNQSPSEFTDRGGSGAADALNVLESSKIATQTLTTGVTWLVSPGRTNDLRFNWSRTTSQSSTSQDSFGGAAPLNSLPFPDPYNAGNGQFSFVIYSLTQGGLGQGRGVSNQQRQINVVDSFSWQKGAHSLKFGVDIRHLGPSIDPPQYQQSGNFFTVSAAETGSSFFSSVTASKNVNATFRNLGLYAQDTWRTSSRLTLTYGLRWDVDFAPDSTPALPAVTGYSLTDFSHLAIAPAGTPPFYTQWGNVAPRIGVAYQTIQRQRWQSVLRGGFGVFYDLATSEAGNLYYQNASTPPFGNFVGYGGAAFPLSSTQIQPPPIPATATLETFQVANPHLQLPDTLEWNVALEQALGAKQMVSASYVGASGRKLLQTTSVFSPQPTMPDPNFSVGAFLDNTANSNYNALQIQFQRRLSSGLQVLSSYTWSHSIDSASAGSYGVSSNLAVPGAPNQNRGNSDFDIRHAFNAAVSYEMPSPRSNRFRKALLAGWSEQSAVFARSAPPVDITDVNFSVLNGGIFTNIRPDIAPGEPLYLFGGEYPGGKRLNPAGFQNPPVNSSTGNPSRQGDLPRNHLRGFGATEWDFAFHRMFPIRESTKVEFRAEMFNILNHPSFGPPNNQFGNGGFGLSTQTLAQSLSNGTLGSGGFDPLYQIGGPRSIQVALKLFF